MADYILTKKNGNNEAVVIRYLNENSLKCNLQTILNDTGVSKLKLYKVQEIKINQTVEINTSVVIGDVS